MPASATQRLGLPLLAEGQQQKHVSLNAGLERLDVLVQLSVASRSRTSPPQSPQPGERHLVAAGATGAWAGRAGDIAVFDGTGWSFLTPQPGWRAFVEAEGVSLTRHDEHWSEALCRSRSGAALAAHVVEEDVALAGAAFKETAAAFPDRAIVLGVSSRTLAAVTGAPSYGCGIAGEPTKFGGELGAAAGASNVGVIGPSAVYAPTQVRITATSGSFTGGVVRVALVYLMLTPPA